MQTMQLCVDARRCARSYVYMYVSVYECFVCLCVRAIKLDGKLLDPVPSFEEEAYVLLDIV